MTRFPISFSKAYRRWTLALLAVNAVLVFLLAPTLWLMMGLWLMLAVMTWLLLAMPRNKNARIVAVLHDSSSWKLLDSEHQSWPIEWCEGSVVTPYFLALCWRKPEQKKRHRLLIWHDALSISDYRHFCRLYWFHQADTDKAEPH